MKQSRWMSFVEAWANIGVGILVSYLANWLILPLILGHPLGIAENILLTAIYTGISLARSYTLRRVFEALRRPA